MNLGVDILILTILSWHVSCRPNDHLAVCRVYSILCIHSLYLTHHDSIVAVLLWLLFAKRETSSSSRASITFVSILESHESSARDAEQIVLRKDDLELRVRLFIDEFDQCDTNRTSHRFRKMWRQLELTIRQKILRALVKEKEVTESKDIFNQYLQTWIFQKICIRVREILSSSQSLSAGGAEQPFVLEDVEELRTHLFNNESDQSDTNQIFHTFRTIWRQLEMSVRQKKYVW